MMDYSGFIESFRGIACVVSKRAAQDGSSEVTISAANKNYLASVNKLDEEFVPDRPYTYYIAYDPNFEALVDSCVSSRKISHQYVNAGLYAAWIDLYMIPLEDDEDGNGCCLFTYEMTPESDADKMMNISAQTAYMVLETCIKLRENDDFIANLDTIVCDIRKQCESEGCAIILMDSDARKIDILCFDHDGDNDFAPQEEDVFFKPEFYEIVEGWQPLLGGSNCYIISDEEGLKEVEKKDINWYGSLVASGVKNLVLYPLRVGDNLYGYIFATNFNADKTSFIREVMELNAFILSAEVENFRMRMKLEELGRKDMLTGVLNRNAMNRRISDLVSGGESVGRGLGIVFVDVNGLKTVNDSLGHNEGDEMLINVAEKLRTVFDDTDIYRAGGDEFLIMVTDRKREDFYALFDRLASLSRVEGEPAFALGAHYEDENIDVAKIMQTADSNMYRNKAEYYESNPDADRRIR